MTDRKTLTFTEKVNAICRHITNIGITTIPVLDAQRIAREADETVERLTKQINQSNQNYLAAAQEAGERLAKIAVYARGSNELNGSALRATAKQARELDQFRREVFPKLGPLTPQSLKAVVDGMREHANQIQQDLDEAQREERGAQAYAARTENTLRATIKTLQRELDALKAQTPGSGTPFTVCGLCGGGGRVDGGPGNHYDALTDCERCGGTGRLPLPSSPAARETPGLTEDDEKLLRHWTGNRSTNRDAFEQLVRRMIDSHAALRAERQSLVARADGLEAAYREAASRPSQALMDAAVAEQVARAEQLEAESEARRVQLFECNGERRAEWTRAEIAEANLAALTTEHAALREALTWIVKEYDHDGRFPYSQAILRARALLAEKGTTA